MPEPGQPPGPDVLELCDRTVDLRRGIVRGPAGEEKLTTKEVELLSFLAARPGRLVSRDELLVGVWGYRATAVTRAVDNMMRKLRSKVEAHPAEPVHLLTLYGEGYRFEPAPRPVARVGNVVAPLRPELGRADLVRSARASLAERRRCVALVGPQGIGKSTLARRIALEEAGARPGGAWWCAVHDVVDAPELERRIAATVGATDDRLLPVLSATAPLVVLDGCDHLSPAAEALIERLLAATDGFDVVATSRRTRFDRIATLVDVPPLDLASARALVAQHVERIRPNPLSETDLEHLAARLGCWPLAIELAAAQLRWLSAEEVLERRPAGGNPLDEALDASIAALNPADRAVLERINQFELPFGADDVEAVCGPGAASALQRLVDLSLVRVARTEPTARLVMLPPIRDAAARRVSDPEPARLAHLARFVRLAEQALTPPFHAHRARLREGEADAWTAHRFALGRDPDAAAALAVALDHELARLGNLRLRLDVLRASLAARPSPRWVAWLRVAEIEVCAGLGETLPDEDDVFAASLGAAVHAGDLELEAACLAIRSQRLRSRGRPQEAEALCTRGLDLAPAGHARARLWLAVGGSRIDRGELDDAVQAFTACESDARAVDDRRLQGQALTGLALAERFRERLDAAEAWLLRAVSRCADEPRVLLDAELGLAQVAAARGDAERSRAALAAARPQVLRVGNIEREGVARSLEAQLACHDRDWARAEQVLRDWVGQSGAHQRAYAEGTLGVVLRLAGRTAHAVEQLRHGRALAADQGAPTLVAGLTTELAAALAEAGRPEEAEAEVEGSDSADPNVRVARAHIALARGLPTELDALEAEVAAGSLPASLWLRCALRHLRVASPSSSV